MSLALFALPELCQAREYFVDQKHAWAADTNAGSETQPFQSIAPALKLVKPGDVIWVKAGLYEETLAIESSGTANHPITLSAWKDDRVRIASILREVPAAEAWKPVAKSKSWSVQLPPGQPKDLTVLLDGKPIVTEFTNAPPLDDDLNWATYREDDRTLMVNAGGPNPAATHKLQLARSMFGIRLTEDYGFWQFKKLELAWLYAGVVFSGHNSMLEDCYFHDTFREGLFAHGRLLTIRRCNFNRCGYCIGASGSGPANIIEECLFANNGMDGWEDDIRHRQMRYKEGLGPLTFKGDAYGQIFRYNIVADSTGGLWYDGSATGARIIGNAFWDNKYGSGIYNEYSADDTITIGNYFLHACAWTSEPGKEAFRYVIHYKDGKTLNLPVTGDNLADWIADPVKRFAREEKTFSRSPPRFRSSDTTRAAFTAWSSIAPTTAVASRSRASSSSATASRFRFCWASPA